VPCLCREKFSGIHNNYIAAYKKPWQWAFKDQRYFFCDNPVFSALKILSNSCLLRDMFQAIDNR
jgi:hypothetical protein